MAQTRTIKTGALSADEEYRVTVASNAVLRDYRNGEAMQVTVRSPKKDDGSHATLTVRLNDDPNTDRLVEEGGAERTLRGPIYNVSVTPDAAVGGSGEDDVYLTFDGEPVEF